MFFTFFRLFLLITGDKTTGVTIDAKVGSFFISWLNILVSNLKKVGFFFSGDFGFDSG
jgi:hypothetical protein